MEKKIKDYEEELEPLVREFGDVNTALDNATSMQLLNEAIDNYPDAELADRVANSVMAFIQWSEKEREKELEKKEKEKSMEHNESD